MLGDLLQWNRNAYFFFDHRFLYVLCFYVSYTPAAVIRVLEGFGMDGEKESDIYPVLLMNSLLLPLQGWFNVL